MRSGWWRVGTSLVLTVGAVATTGGAAGAAPPDPLSTITWDAGTATLALEVRGTGVVLSCPSGTVVATEAADPEAPGQERPIAVTPTAPACADVGHLSGTGAGALTVPRTVLGPAPTLDVTLGTSGIQDLVTVPLAAGQVTALSQYVSVIGPETSSPRSWVATGHGATTSIVRASTKLDVGGQLIALTTDHEDVRVGRGPIDGYLTAADLDGGESTMRVDAGTEPWTGGCLPPGGPCVVGTASRARVLENGRVLVYDLRVDPWVPLVYQRLLARTPSAAERDGWLTAANRVTNPMPALHTVEYVFDRSRIPAGIIGSTEYRRRLVAELYQEVIGRAPTTAERDRGVAGIRDGRTPDSLRAGLAGSATFFTQSGSTRAGFADRLYRRLLGRAGTAAERQAVVNQLGFGTTRAQVAAALLARPEAARRHAVLRYRQALAREPSATSASQWTSYLQAHGELATLRAILSSTASLSQALHG